MLLFSVILFGFHISPLRTSRFGVGVFSFLQGFALKRGKAKQEAQRLPVLLFYINMEE